MELEVSHLEQYLLSLYRKAFDGQISSTSPMNSPKSKYMMNCIPDITSKKEDKAVQSGYDSFGNPVKEYSGIRENKLLDSRVRRCQSSLSHYSVSSKRTYLPDDSLGQAVRPCLSQPMSMIEVAVLCFITWNFTRHNRYLFFFVYGSFFCSLLGMLHPI